MTPLNWLLAGLAAFFALQAIVGWFLFLSGRPRLRVRRDYHPSSWRYWL